MGWKDESSVVGAFVASLFCCFTLIRHIYAIYLDLNIITSSKGLIGVFPVQLFAFVAWLQHPRRASEHPPAHTSKGPFTLALNTSMSKSRSVSVKREKSPSSPSYPSPMDIKADVEDIFAMNTPEVVSKPQSPVVEEASVTPPPVKAVKPERKGPQLIGDLPIATEEALRTFIPLPGNHYQYSTLGRTRETLESMTCDCQYEHG